MREYFIFFLLASFLFYQCFFSYISSHKDQKILKNIIIQEISVEVQGEVRSPGIYIVAPGISMKQLLKKTGVSKKADLKKIKISKKFYEDTKIIIPSQKSKKNDHK